MKLLIVPIVLLGVFSAVSAQVTKPVTKPVAPQQPVLKTQADSLSYVIGELLASKLVSQGLEDLRATNGNALLQGLNDILDKKKTRIDDVTANALLNNYFTKIQAEKSKANIDSGNKFLARNKLKPGVITTASGMQYEVITLGTGIKPAITDTFVAHYRGTLLNGSEFDASYNRGQPLTYPLSDVIIGWKEGLQLMPVGSKYKFYIPYNLGYGVMGQGQQIPGGSLLVFELELLDVKKKQ